MLLFVATGCGGKIGNQNPAQATGGSVEAVQLVTSSEGWLLTDDALVWISSVTGSSREITPAVKAPSSIGAAFFLDAEHGWAVARSRRTENATELTVFRTANNGSSWTAANLMTSAAAWGPSAIDFINARHGWLLVGIESSSNFSVGELYRTADGGATWTKLSAPSGGTIRFATPTLGFLAGGPVGERLFVTRDGGNSWQSETVELPQAFADAVPVYTTPSFQAATSGVLPVTLSGAAASAVAFYVTSDAGASWKLAAVRLVPGSLGQGVSVATDVLGTDSWVVVAPNGARVFSTADGGRSWRVVAPTGLPAGVSQVDFASLTRGWSLVATGRCAGSKEDCTFIREARGTADGGKTWEGLADR